MSIENIIETAKGNNNADLVIKNVNLINVLSEEIYITDVAIKDGIIAGIGTGYTGNKEIDGTGKYLSSLQYQEPNHNQLIKISHKHLIQNQKFRMERLEHKMVTSYKHQGVNLLMLLS